MRQKTYFIRITQDTKDKLDELRDPKYHHGIKFSPNEFIRDVLIPNLNKVERYELCEEFLRMGGYYGLKQLMLKLHRIWREKYSDESHPLHNDENHT